MTPRRETLSAGAGVLLLLAGSFLIALSHGPMHDTRIAGAAVRILEPTRSPQTGTAIVFHGLSANRILMQGLGQWFAAQGLRVYLAEAPGHGNTSGPFSHADTLDSSLRVLAELVRTGQIDPQTTVLAGHSMGGEIAIRLADYFPSAATIALSPAPMVLPRRMPSNLLIISAQFDLPPMKSAAEKLLRTAGGERISPEDFRQRRAADRIILPWSSHTTVLFDPRASKAMARWARAALGLTGPPEYPTGSPLTGELLGIAGLCLVFPFTTTRIVRTFRIKDSPERAGVPLPAAALLARWCVAALLALGIVNLWYPQRLFPFYAGGYLASFLLLAGAALALLFRHNLRGLFGGGYGAILAALLLGFLVILSFGAWLNWQVTDVWMNGARWFHFVPLLLANLPYTLVEETVLGPPEPSRRTRRFGMFFALRAILWLALLAGLLVLWSGQVLLVLLAPYFAVVSLGQRLGADSLRCRTGSPVAAAMFSAILAAWFMAAVFPSAGMSLLSTPGPGSLRLFH
jgi:pimeloyl-ACP methyl ester carboxylesterase